MSFFSGLTDKFELRKSYKAAFNTGDGKRICRDLIKQYVMSDPVGSSPEITLINIGMQRLTMNILEKAYGSDEAIRVAIEEAYQQQKQSNNE